MAEEYEKSDQWLRALRLYSDLSSLEPANPEWKDRLKLATRRIRLLALYTPSQLKALQEIEIKNRKEVDKLLAPTTQETIKRDGKVATSQPLAGEDKLADEKADPFTIDWRESLRDIRADMLWDALVDARTNYFRDVSYRGLALGGLKGLQTIATTKGLENAFPNLADAGKRKAFLAAIDESIGLANASTIINERMTLQRVLTQVQEANKNSIELPDEVLVSEFADGAFAELDPFSSMIWPSELEEFNKATQGEFTGVGIQIQNDEDGSLKVVSPLEDSPAYRAGIKAGDIITHINGKSAKGITLNQAVKTITGTKGTPVRLTVRSPDRTTKEYPLVREVIKVGSIKGWLHRPGGGWEYFVDPELKIAYMRMTNFTKTTSEDLDKATEELTKAGARAIILDLRYNPGGLLTAATEVSDKFLKNGVIVSTKPDRDTPNQQTVATAKADDNEITLPTVVLVNQYSASASEIVSGALKDQKRALVVGERTFGKGSVQMLFPLSDRRAYLKLTTSHYYLPSNRCIHREENSLDWGVDPDVTVEMTPEQMRAAIDARQEMDILRDANALPAEGTQPKLDDKSAAVKDAVANEKKGKDPLACDPQLSAALLLLRLQLTGAHL
jgi:carboxyl-terminal processing protease